MGQRSIKDDMIDNDTLSGVAVIPFPEYPVRTGDRRYCLRPRNSANRDSPAGLEIPVLALPTKSLPWGPSGRHHAITRDDFGKRNRTK